MEAESLTQDGKRMLLFAARDGDETCTDLLLSSVQNKAEALNMSLDEDGNTAIMYALGKSTTTTFPERYRQYVAYLIKQGANVNTQNHRGLTPLIGACLGHDQPQVILLLENDADEDMVDVEGRSAAQLAKEWHEATVIELLNNKRRAALKASL